MAFEDIIDGVLKWEAGYQTNTKDSGNFYEGKLVGTNFGISARTLAEYLGRTPTSEDMQNLTKEEAKKIYKTNYYDRYKIDQLPEDLKEVAMHSVVMSGNKGIKDIQQLIGVEDDGSIGPNTLKALEKQKISSVELKNAILDRYKNSEKSKWDEFGKGWTNRYNDVVPETKKVEAPKKQSSVFTGQEIKVADASGKVPIGGIKQLDQQIVKPYNSFGFRNNNLNENVQKSITTDTIDVSAPRIPYDMQEAARRSMMHGNEEERMADYAYAREQARRPFVNRYPVDSRGQGAYSTAAPMGNQAARMMGFANGGPINTQGQRPMMTNPQTQANGLASLGRGGDSTLVHMQPQEVAGLQQLAQANGTSLTTNPDTGMPEAFKLGNFFRAALPIAAGYFLGPAAGGLMSGTGAAAYGASGALGGSIAAGAATGGTLAAMSGEDVLAGTLSGGLGGMSGGGLNTAFGGAGVPEALGGTPALAANATETAKNIAEFGPLTGQGGSPFAGGGFNMDAVSANLGTPEMRAMTDADKFGGAQLGKDGRFMVPTGNITPAGPLQMGMKLGSPLASMGIGGLEESDFMVDPEFNDPRDKYDPYSKLNLNEDTGVSDAMRADTGLRLFGGGGTVGPTSGYAQGGYLNTGGTVGDGMSDSIPATINGDQPAALSDGEFVIPADVVSHLGNGSSSAGAQRLKDMMSRLRKARTGNEEQGKQIAPKKYMPA
jgi:lysozyme family protein